MTLFKSHHFYLSVVMLLYHFCLNFILSEHTGYAGFDFNWPSVFTEAVFSFEKGSNRQNHSSWGSYYSVKKSPPAKFLIPLPLTAIWKTLCEELSLINSTSSTRGSYFDNCTGLLRKTGPEWESHVGKDVPVDVYHLKLNIFSCGVQLVDMKIRLWINWRASGIQFPSM